MPLDGHMRTELEVSLPSFDFQIVLAHTLVSDKNGAL
jgi:hypothetical protein